TTSAARHTAFPWPGWLPPRQPWRRRSGTASSLALSGRYAICHIWYNGGVEKTTLYIPADLQRALRSLARRQRKPQAEIIREALSAYVREQARPRLGSVGLGEDDQVTGATSEDYLRSRWRAG